VSRKRSLSSKFDLHLNSFKNGIKKESLKKNPRDLNFELNFKISLIQKSRNSKARFLKRFKFHLKISNLISLYFIYPLI
jgi:hypothetical protein